MIRSQILGQNKLLEKLDKYTLDNFPHSVLLLGEEGCGKHTISKYIAENILNVPYYDISENISYELLEDIYAKATIGLYVIDMSKITEKEQNSILKFVEEPLSSIFVILLSQSKSILLPTIINRCVSFEFSNYTAEDLKKFLPTDQQVADNILENILKTPGKVRLCDTSKLQEIYELCEKIFDKISLATYSNALSIAQKINYKDNYDKYDFSIFMNTLIFCAYKRALSLDDEKIFKQYMLIIDLYKQLQDSRLNKEIFTEKLISNLWRLAR